MQDLAAKTEHQLVSVLQRVREAEGVLGLDEKLKGTERTVAVGKVTLSSQPVEPCAHEDVNHGEKEEEGERDELEDVRAHGIWEGDV